MHNSPVSNGRMIVCLVAAALFGACGVWNVGWGTHSKRAVELAIQDHLRQNRSLISSNFDTQIESVNFKGDTAEALVRFQSKQSAQLSVEVRYGLRLERERWEVVSSTPMSGQGGDSHGAPEDGPSAPGGTQPATPPAAPA
ncbi:MAG TPA: hypothetical protein VI455_00715, partial [Terriglobia bacterium]